jgi:secreted trypsin-like serine protease
MRRVLLLCSLVCAVSVAPANAVVGGHDVANGAYPAVADITFGAFGCTGTLIAPNAVLTAGHCGSITGGSGVGSPASWPTPLITVRIGGTHSGEGETVPVKSVTVNPNYLANQGYDISILTLSRNSTKTPVKVSGTSETSLWTAGTMETIVGWGYTSEGGSPPNTLQEANVPVTTDSYCAGAYSQFSAATMICAGYPAGGVDTCQGDSGGPMFGHTSTGALRVVGTTSFGEGCAEPGKPGVYGRVGDTTLREWIRSKVPSGVA